MRERYCSASDSTGAHLCTMQNHSSLRGAKASLEALAAEVPVPISSIAIRVCPELPPSTEERIADNRAQTVADSVM